MTPCLAPLSSPAKSRNTPLKPTAHHADLYFAVKTRTRFHSDPIRSGLGPTVLRLLSLGCLCIWAAYSIAQTTPDAAPNTVPAARQADNLAILTIRDEITRVTARSIERRLTIAERAGADALVIEIDTPGGDLEAVLAICTAIKKSRITNTVAWINPNAYSGGAIIALACKRMVTSSPAAMGDAIPIQLMPGVGIKPLPEAERQKALAPLMSEIVDSARRNGYDEMLVQGIASLGVELWLVENPDTSQRITINEAEYKIIFGEDPIRGVPRLASARPDTSREAAAAPAGEVGQQGDPPRRRHQTGEVAPGVAEPPPTSAVHPADEGDPRRFTPASPNLAPLAEKYPEEQLPASKRPVITSADRGKWSLIEYTSSGHGPFIFKEGDLLDYGLASATIDTDEELKAYMGAKNLLRLDQNWSEWLVAFLTSWAVRAVLIVVFLIALFLEMTNPGLVLPGTVAMLALISLIAPPMLINLANWWEIAAILGGISLIALEIFVIPGFGFFGIVGVLALFGGLIGTFVPEGGMFPDSPSQQNDLLYGVATLVLSVATAGVGIYLLSKHFGSLPLFGKLVLKDAQFADADEMLAAIAPDAALPVKVGMPGRALSPMRPAGRVEVNGRIIDAVAAMGYIAPGAQVVVTEVSPFRIAVERVTGAAPPGGDRGRAA